MRYILDLVFYQKTANLQKICNECNIEFIGPSVESMINMGNKSIARQTMIKAGVPVVPGTNEPLTDAYQGKKIADEIGYPVIVKAVSGGGGKGMREVRKSEDFVKLFETAKKETEIAFGDDQMYIEKFVESKTYRISDYRGQIWKCITTRRARLQYSKKTSEVS